MDLGQFTALDLECLIKTAVELHDGTDEDLSTRQLEVLARARREVRIDQGYDPDDE